VKDSLTYDGFGKITAETDINYRGRYTWTGREIDIEIELQYNRARYYDASVGRWMTEDPLGFDAGDSNLFRYVTNRFVTDRDPSGLVDPPVSMSLSAVNVLGAGDGANPFMAFNGRFWWGIRWELSAPAHAERGGWIGQHLKVTFSDPKHPANNDGRSWEYWEYWRVAPCERGPKDARVTSPLGDTKKMIKELMANENLTPEDKKYAANLLVPLQISNANVLPKSHDIYSLVGAPAGTKGWVKFEGRAYYFDGMAADRLPPQFEVGGGKAHPTHSGGLRSIASTHPWYGLGHGLVVFPDSGPKGWTVTGPVKHNIEISYDNTIPVSPLHKRRTHLVSRTP
jgi:RHS repeat-associated protein